MASGKIRWLTPHAADANGKRGPTLFSARIKFWGDRPLLLRDHSGTCVRRILLIVVIWEPFWHDFGTILGPSGDRWGDMVAYCQLGSVQKGSSIPS